MEKVTDSRTPQQKSAPSSQNHLKEKQSASFYGLEVKATPNGLSSRSIQKKFLIFDRSGDETRIILVPTCSPLKNPNALPTKFATNFVGVCNLRDEKQAEDTEQLSPVGPILQEKSDENPVLEGGDVHEDTRDIDALLYSDDDEEGDDDGDEVTSTDRSPSLIKELYNHHEIVKEITEEDAGSDGPAKRRRLLDGRYNKSSFPDLISSVKPDRTRDDDAESSQVKNSKDSILSGKSQRKDNIRKTLKILETIIPGLKSEDPLLIIDEAINYLKLLKLKAKALGFDNP